MSGDFVLDTPVVRAFVADVEHAIAGASSPEDACAAIRPRFAELLDDAGRCDTDRYAALFRHLLERRIYIAPSQFEAMFLSLAHEEEEIDRTTQAVAKFGG